MKVFITGIAGFIGFHLAKSLASQGHEISGIDNFNDYYDVKLKTDRSENLQEAYPKTEVIKGDIRDLKSYKGALSGTDLVVHLAAYTNPRYALKHPHLFIDSNIGGTQTLIEEVERAKVPFVVYASSSSVMHGQLTPWKEDHPIYHQTNPYSWSKFANECQFKHSNIHKTVGLRFFTVYGPWGRPDMALYDFTNKIIKGQKSYLYNYGHMWRDFTYIDDIIQGINLVIAHTRVSDDKKIREIYNIGYGQKVPLMSFIDALEKHLGKQGLWELVPSHPADTPETWSDTSKLKKIGYNPTTPIEVGIKKFVEWYKEYYRV